MFKKIKNKHTIFLYVIFIVMMIGVIGSKINFHLDELLSYGLANSFDSSAIKVDWGIAYGSEAIERLFVDYLSADENATFDYAKVWANQAADVHPPLYYVLLHTISSLFPGEFSIWFAGIINIVFAVLTLYILRKLVDIMFQSSTMTNLTSIMFVLSAEILSATSFLRMYIVAIFFVTLLTWFFVKKVDEQWNGKDYLFLFIVSVLSALTHYYCVVYLIFICVVYGVWLLIKKQWKKTLSFVVTMALSGVTAIAIFPAMLEHVFSGYRGANSMDNFKNTSLSDYMSRLNYFFDVFNRKIFGNVFIYVIMFLVIVAFLKLFSKNRENGEKKHVPFKNEYVILRWCLIAVPTILYFFLIAKIAVYHSDRYMVPIYATSIICFMGILYYSIKYFLAPATQNICLCIICAIIIANGWQEADWPYLYRDSQVELDGLEEYAAADCIVIYDSMHNVQMSWKELCVYNSVTFIDKYNYYWISDWECTKGNELVLMMFGTDESDLQTILDFCPNMDNYKRIGNYGVGTTYYLY